MFKIGQSRALEQDEVEIKVIPLQDNFLITFSSGILVGTLAIDKTIEKDELREFGEALYELIQQYDLYDTSGNDELPQ